MNKEELSYYLKRYKELEQTGENKLKIAILSSFTINGLGEIISVKCHDDINTGLLAYAADYNQIDQEIIDADSGLRKFKPDITAIFIDHKYLLGDNLQKLLDQNLEQRSEYINGRTQEFFALARIFLDNIEGTLIVSNLPLLSYSPFGIFDEKTQASYKDAVVNFNYNLKKEFIGNNRVYIVDLAAFFSKYGEYNIVDEKMLYLADMYISPQYLPLLAEEIMSFIKPFCSKNKKCIVLDLDNTIWGGVVGEDGFNNIKLDDDSSGKAYKDFQKYIRELYKTGIILAINSKNNPEDALEVIEKHPHMMLREKDFASIQINWDDKVSNLKRIAKEINIGTDSLVFVDDDPINRGLVRELMPEVLVVDLPEDPSNYVRFFKSLNDFNRLQITNEDFRRGESYYQDRKRNQFEKEFHNIEDFIKSLQLEVKIDLANAFTAPRISQLTKKTNQFNLTARKYSEEDITNFINSSAHEAFSVNVKDRFGDYGLTGSFIINKESDKRWGIETFLLSCRILGRKVEDHIIEYIINLARKNQIEELVGEYIPTAKNIQTADFYEKRGFQKINENLYVLKIKR
ncbi:MAG: HAD-IIIC family phosphatase [Patescibacteria group bacterium]